MTIDDIWEYIQKNNHRITPDFCLELAKKVARDERKKIAEEVLKGTGEPISVFALRSVQRERKRIYNVIIQGVEK